MHRHTQNGRNEWKIDTRKKKKRYVYLYLYLHIYLTWPTYLYEQCHVATLDKDKFVLSFPWTAQVAFKCSTLHRMFLHTHIYNLCIESFNPKRIENKVTRHSHSSFAVARFRSFFGACVCVCALQNNTTNYIKLWASLYCYYFPFSSAVYGAVMRACSRAPVCVCVVCWSSRYYVGFIRSDFDLVNSLIHYS